MMRHWLRRLCAIAALLAAPTLAHAYCESQLPSSGATVLCTVPSMSTGWATVPVTGTSTAITSGMVAGTNSPAFPMTTNALPSQGFVAYNQIGSAGPIYVCPLGGACDSTHGIEVPAGASKTLGTGSSKVVPTAQSPLGGTLEVRW